MLHTYKENGPHINIVRYYIIFKPEPKEMCFLFLYISVTHIEHVELWPTDLFLSRTSACGSAVVFADFCLASTSM